MPKPQIKLQQGKPRDSCSDTTHVSVVGACCVTLCDWRDTQR